MLTLHERFLFGPRPAFDLSFALACFGKCHAILYPQDLSGRIQLCGSTSLTGQVIIKPLGQINRTADINDT
jgi:hypothetical protein